MDNSSSSIDILEPSFSTTTLVIKAIITISLIYIAQLIETNLSKGKRTQLAKIQRDFYHKELGQERLKMEEKELQEELEQVKHYQSSTHENEELRNQLNESNYDDEEEEEEDEDSNWSGSNDEDRVKEEEKVLEEFEKKDQELKAIDNEISNSIQILKKDDLLDEPIVEPPPIAQRHLEVEESENDETDEDVTGKHESALQVLNERIKQIESENEELKAQVKSFSSLSTTATQQTKLDPDLQQYLEDHSDVLTLDFLEKAYETLIEIKALNPDKNFDDYIEELRNARTSYDNELQELKVTKKEAEIKLKLMKQEYEKELASFNEIRIEHIFKNSGAKDYLERLKEKNKLNVDIIRNLEHEIETLKAALADCQMRYQRAEEEHSKMYQGYQQMKAEKERIEAERRAKDARIANQTMNMSSASSLVESSVPPMPPLNNIPSIDELLGGNSIP